MMDLRSHFRRLIADRGGAVAVEAAFVIPMLATMALGSFEISNIIARQSELQGAMAEASSVALAAEPTTQTRREALRTIILQTIGDTTTVTVDEAFRCGSETVMRTSTEACGGTRASSYVKVALADTYRPIWTKYGVGAPLNFRVTRYVMIKQQSD
jgi:Flp pilus assembly protein TadG